MDDDKNNHPFDDADKELNENKPAEEINHQEDVMDDLKNDIPEEDIIFTNTTADDPDKDQPATDATTNDNETGKKFNSTCRCFEKPDGKYYCYELIQGNWVQVSIIPFDSQQECEDSCC